MLHLGAHLGQEAELYDREGKAVIWVEALPHIHARLQQRLAAFPRQRAICALLGARDDEPRTFHISNNGEGVSSSLYPFGEFGSGGQSLWPALNLGMVAQITLKSVTVDTLLEQRHIDCQAYDFWVVDVQGAELEVLAGASRSLAHCNAIYIEASTVEVYRGGAIWREVSRHLEGAGFVALWAPQGGHDDVLLVRQKAPEPLKVFHAENYLRHNHRRLEHLATLELPLHGRSILEVGAGIGDHTSFYLDRGCAVLVTDAREENIAVIRSRYAHEPRAAAQVLDLDAPALPNRQFEVIHCYGLLYHLARPEQAIAFLAAHCTHFMVLETCVTPDAGMALNPVSEPAADPSQAVSGTGCRPTRAWVWAELKKVFPWVYATATQPSHPEFPLDWNSELASFAPLTRAVFVASKMSLDSNPNLLATLPTRQEAV